MRKDYKRLGDYIQPVEGRNTELRDIPLMGLSINKVFIPSITNTIGQIWLLTELSNENNLDMDR